MVTINKVMLMGHVGADPEVRHLADDRTVARFRLATGETYTDKNGEKVTTTEWHTVVAWKNAAKIIESYVRKGSELYIEGKLTHRTYEKNGETKYVTEVVAETVRLGRKNEHAGDVSGFATYANGQADQPFLLKETDNIHEMATVSDNDLPF